MTHTLKSIALCGSMSFAMVATAFVTGGVAQAQDSNSGQRRLNESKEIKGLVIALDGSDVVVDIGISAGASLGDVIELWRPIRVKHPVSGKILVDRFKIGSLKLTQVRDTLSLAKPEGNLLRAVVAGDVVLFAPPSTVPLSGPNTGLPSAPGERPAPPAEPTAPSSDPDAQTLSSLFEQLRGQPPEVRAQAYDRYALAHPQSRFVAVLREEALALRSRPSVAAARLTLSPPELVSFDRPDRILDATSLSIGVELQGVVSGALLHLRAADQVAYVTFPMVRAGRKDTTAYWSLVVASEHIRAPSMSFFIEAVTPSGSSVPVVGTASDPRIALVESTPTAESPTKHENLFAIWSEFADYNRLRKNDYAWQTEGYFGMRFGDRGLRAVRSGFGVYKGKGGGLADLDDHNRDPRSVGLSYGYVEAEWGLSSMWGLVARAAVGLGENGVTGGGQGFVRIGNDKKTNLLVGGEVLGGVGIRGITQIELNMFPRVPILIRTEVTNQPAGSSLTSAQKAELKSLNQSADQADLGVRAILQAGYRITPPLTVFLRGSYQGRTINHAGPGVGAGVSYTW